MERIALGRLGWSEQQFADTTPRAFVLAMDGHAEVEQQRTRMSWEQTRYIAWAVLAPNSKKKIKPTDLLKFDDERPKPKPAEPIDPELEAKLIRKFEAMN